MPKKPHEALPPGWEAISQHIGSALSVVEARDSDEPLPTAMFVFVREMMRYPWNDTYREDPDRVADLIERMWPHARDGEYFWVAWERYDSDYHADARGLFVRVWLQMRCPPGADPLLTASAYAEHTPMTLQFKAQMLDNPHYRRLLNVCYYLQKLMGSKPVALPQDRLALIVGKSQQTISGYLTLAERSGILKKVARHDFRANLAAKFQVATELFKPIL
jgi:hypothetical protein